MDNVAMVLASGKPGDRVNCGRAEITLQDQVPYGHKVAFQTIHKGEPVMKYGQPIGVAACEIAPGQHVHIHNVLGHKPFLRGQKEG